MPELPEVESVRRSLLNTIVGKRVTAVRLRRPDVVTDDRRPTALLQGCVITGIDRLGKELAIIGQNGGPMRRCMCIHLGMSGSLQWTASDGAYDRHVHVVWRLDGAGDLVFRDPRRFGGVWTFPSTDDREARRWATRGEDALTITPGRLHGLLAGTQRAIKAALLDQTVLAGVGNIYADETLFAAGIHPMLPARCLKRSEVTYLISVMRRILRQAIMAGGSTLRDGGYVNGDGQTGRFQDRHQVYGRGGLACRKCATPLQAVQLSARTTVYCPGCQPLRFPMNRR